MYNKKWKQLKRLDDRGAETYKIDSTRASIRNLSTKISVVIRSIDTISSRVHKIRDEELQPQLIELIQGLIKMWNFVLDCHQKQLQALVHSRTDKLMAKTGTQRNSVARATRELEMELLRWRVCFKDWIDTQRDYIEALNGWLMKWLIQEEEVTSDGVIPFSPSQVGAPASFIISNDWYNAIESVSEVEVTRSIQSFAGNLHEMQENQKKEINHRRKAEYLSVDLARRLKSLHGNQGTVVTTGDPVANNDAAMKALELLRKRLEEERAKHEEIVKHIQQGSSSCLGTGLVPIFEALKNFTLKMVQAYEKLRIPNESLE